ncbi:MAG TPA: hypothetical protein ENL33_00400 [Candidatus Parcubacteria bacterium]|nr:hypothetical protein [Candidatus Parcubacteria bacterium]
MEEENKQIEQEESPLESVSAPEDKNKVDSGKSRLFFMTAFLFGLAAIILLLGVWHWWKEEISAYFEGMPYPSGVSVSVSKSVPEDTTKAINQELNNIDIGDLDAEFEAIDQDLNSL